jgi:hypothetical protein
MSRAERRALIEREHAALPISQQCRSSPRRCGHRWKALPENEALSPKTAAEIVERADGIPVFVEELTKAELGASGQGRGGREDTFRRGVAIGGRPSGAACVVGPTHTNSSSSAFASWRFTPPAQPERSGSGGSFLSTGD